LEIVMATITSLGIGTGTDLNAIVTQLVAVERAPLRALERSAQRLQTQVSSVGRIQSLFSTLQDASNKLTGNGLWTQSTATSGNEAAVSTVGGATAAAGNYSVNVTALASSQTLTTAGPYTSATDLVGAGTMTFDIGTWAAGSTAFTAKAGGTPLVITASATDTLQTLRDKINGAGAGVTASLVTDSSGVRLAIRSSSTGLENGFRIAASGGLSAFSYDPPSGGTGMVQKQAAADAKATVNGIDISSPSNDLTGTVEGLTLRLRQVTTAPVDVSVAQDNAAVTKAVGDFAAAYSALSLYITEQTKYDAGTKQGGVLQGDSAVYSLQGRLRGVLNTPSGASSKYPRLSDLGLELQRDGSLTVNSAKLGTAMTNLPELKKALANNDTVTPDNNGFAKRYAALANQVLGIDGTVTTHTAGLQKLITKNGVDQTKLNERVDRFQARLTAQYSAMDVAQSRLSALSSYVSQQIAQMNRSSGR
jgi:flagellar hook-associated protein 2